MLIWMDIELLHLNFFNEKFEGGDSYVQGSNEP
jgi:hypothetical protein